MDHRRLARRFAIAFAAATVAAGTYAGTQPVSAAGLFGSTTTVTAAMTRDGHALRLHVTVTTPLVGIGFGGRSAGYVTFADDQSDALGAVDLTNCSASTCSASYRVKTSKLGPVVGAITATYSGDGLLNTSHGAAPVLFLRCAKTALCRSGKITVGPTTVELAVPAGDSALATLGGPALPCSIRSGSVINVATTGTRKTVQVGMYEAGSAYAGLDGSLAGRTSGHLSYRCDASTLPFKAFTPAPGAAYAESSQDFARYGEAPKATSGRYRGDYVGLLAGCFYRVRAPHRGACTLSETSSAATFDAADILIFAGTGVTHLAG